MEEKSVISKHWPIHLYRSVNDTSYLCFDMEIWSGFTTMYNNSQLLQ